MTKRIALTIVVIGMIIAPLVLMIIPYDYFDHGESICPSKILFNKECPGCGTTRATMRLAHFRFAEAWEFNKLSFISVPFIGFLYVRIIFKLIRKLRGQKSSGSSPVAKEVD